MKLQSSLVLVHYLASGVLALPLSLSEIVPRSLWLVDRFVIGIHGGRSPVQIDQTTIDKFELYSQYSAAAYCESNDNSSNTQIKCNQGNCPLVEAANATGVLEFQNSLYTDVTGYVSIVPSAKTIVLAFRGSNSIQNFIADVEFVMTTVDLCDGCHVHSGFWLSWTEARSEILNSYSDLVKNNPDYELVVTGHSLGGAIALLAAAELRQLGFPIALYTYGQPRVGDPSFSSWVDSQPGAGNFRVTHTDDPVPRLAPLALGYDHISPEYHIETDSPTPSTSQIVEYDGDANLDGNAGTSGFDIGAHLNYFGNISACGSFEI